MVVKAKNLMETALPFYQNFMPKSELKADVPLSYLVPLYQREVEHYTDPEYVAEALINNYFLPYIDFYGKDDRAKAYWVLFNRFDRMPFAYSRGFDSPAKALHSQRAELRRLKGELYNSSYTKTHSSMNSLFTKKHHQYPLSLLQETYEACTLLRYMPQITERQAESGDVFSEKARTYYGTLFRATSKIIFNNVEG